MPTRFLDAFNLHHHPSSSRDSKSLKWRKSWTLRFITISYNTLWTGRVTSPMNVHGNLLNFSNMLRTLSVASTLTILTGLPPKIYHAGAPLCAISVHDPANCRYDSKCQYAVTANVLTLHLSLLVLFSASWILRSSTSGGGRTVMDTWCGLPHVTAFLCYCSLVYL